MLLTTKLFVPQLRHTLVARPRLFALLDAGLAGKLILVSAPAGFGKTTLVSQWLDAGRSATLEADEASAADALKSKIQNPPSCWLSLDADDNDPSHFLLYLVAALQRIEPDLGRSVTMMLASSQPPPLDTLMTALLNELASVVTPCLLVLDDFHTVTNPAIHQAFTVLVEQLPPTIHLLLLTRVDPPLPLARWRVRRVVTEIRASDLRFSPTECAFFLRQSLSIDLGVAAVAALEERTEGWIAGLQLAALSLQGHQDIAGFIDQFTGSHIYIVDYLVEEVLQRQPPVIERFLLETSLLDRLSGPLCDALTGRDDGQVILEELQRANLFLIALDDERRWYRYHHLFAEVLRNRLQQEAAATVPQLHRRAAQWYAGEGLQAAAIRHRLAAGDFAVAAGLIEGYSEALLKRGEHSTVHEWLNALPDAVVRDHSRLSLARAAELVLRDQPQQAEEYLQAVEQRLAAGPLDPNLLGQLYTLRARNAQRSNQLAAALEWSERALHVLPAENLLARSQATLYMGNAFVFADRVVDAILAFAEAGQLAQQAGDIHTALHALCNQGIMQITHGQLHQGAATFATGLALAKEHQVEQITMVGAHEANLATILYEWDRLEEAEARFRAAIAKYDHSTDGATKVLLRGHLALLLNAHGDHPGARQLIARLLAQGRQQKLPEVRLLAGVAIQLRLWMRQGETTAVLSWLRSCGLQVDDELSVLNYYGYNSLARALLHVGRLEEAAHLCARLVAAAAASGRQRAWIELRALQALTWQAQGKAEAARQLLADTLRQAEPAGYIRTFVDEGEAMRLLILECRFWLARQTPAAQQGRLLAYVDRLLAAFAPANQGEREGASLAHPPSQNLVDPLSERELEVLRLAYEGLSNPQIATQLNVVVGTVKRHINNIFSKLGVTSRTQALARGRELGLLP